MGLWRLPTQCALLMVISLLHQHSAFVLLPSDVYWLSQQHYPREKTLPRRSLQTRVASPTKSRHVTLTLPEPSYRMSSPSYSSVRHVPKVATRSALPSYPFSPWRGKRGGGGEGGGRRGGRGTSTQLFTNAGYFSPWRGKRSTDFSVPRHSDTILEQNAKLSTIPNSEIIAQGFMNDEHLSPWRGENSTETSVLKKNDTTIEHKSEQSVISDSEIPTQVFFNDEQSSPRKGERSAKIFVHARRGDTTPERKSNESMIRNYQIPTQVFGNNGHPSPWRGERSAEIYVPTRRSDKTIEHKSDKSTILESELSTHLFVSDEYFSQRRGKRSARIYVPARHGDITTEHKPNQSPTSNSKSPTAGVDSVEGRSTRDGQLIVGARRNFGPKWQRQSDRFQYPQGTANEMNTFYVPFEDAALEFPSVSSSLPPFGINRKRLQSLGREDVQNPHSDNKDLRYAFVENEEPPLEHTAPMLGPSTSTSEFEFHDKLKATVNDEAAKMVRFGHSVQNDNAEELNLQSGNEVGSSFAMNSANPDSESKDVGIHSTEIHHSELLPETNSDDWSIEHHDKFISDDEWLRLLGMHGPGSDDDQMTIAKGHSSHGRVYDHSQPGVGPFFWVVNDEDSEESEKADVMSESFLVDDALSGKQKPVDFTSNKTHNSPAYQDKIINSFLHDYPQMKSSFIEDNSQLQKATNMAYESRLQSLDSDFESHFQKEKLLRDPDYEAFRSDITSEEKHSPSQPQFNKHWEPVFSKDFTLERTGLPVPVTNVLRAMPRSETSVQHMSVPSTTPALQQSPPSSLTHHPLSDLPAIQSDKVSMENPTSDSNLFQPGRVPNVNPVPNSNNDVVGAETLSTPENRESVKNKTSGPTESPQMFSIKMANIDESVNTLDAEPKPEDEDSQILNNEQINKTQSSIQNMDLEAVPLNDLDTHAESNEPDANGVSDNLDANVVSPFPKEGAELVSSFADVLADPVDGKQVIKYQELVVLSTEGGITLTTDNSGHLTVAIDSFNDNVRHNDTQESAGSESVKNPLLKQRNRKHSNVPKMMPFALYQSHPEFQINHERDAQTSNTGYGKPTKTSNVSGDPKRPVSDEPYAISRTTVLQSKPIVNSLSNPKTNNSPTNSPSGVTGTYLTDREFHNYEGNPTVVEANKHNTKNGIAKNRIPNAMKAFIAFSMIQQVPFRKPPYNGSSNAPTDPTNADSKARRQHNHKKRNVLSRNRREAEVQKQNETSARGSSPQQQQIITNSRSSLHEFVSVGKLPSRQKKKNDSALTSRGSKQSMLTSTFSKLGMHSKMGKPSTNRPRNIGDIESQLSFGDPKENNVKKPPKDEDLIGNNSQTLMQNKKRFLTRDDHQTALRQMRRFYQNYFPSRRFHKPVNGQGIKPMRSHTGFARRLPTKPQWDHQSANPRPVLEHYVLSTGRTFKPNWFFRNAKPTGRQGGNPWKTADGKNSSKPKPHTRQVVAVPRRDNQASTTTKNAVTFSNNLPGSNATISDDKPFTLTHSKTNNNNNFRAFDADELLHNMNRVFLISLNIQFTPVVASRPGSRGQMSSGGRSGSPVVLRRQRRSANFRAVSRYDSYILYPLGNVGWITFPYYHYTAPHLPPPTVMAQYRVG